MKKRLFTLASAMILAAETCPAVTAAPVSALLDVTDFQIMDENLVYIGADYLNPASVLFDDQALVPESPDNTDVDGETFMETNRTKNWKPNWQDEFGDDAFYMDLGANYVITGICFLDSNGVQDWRIEDGEPFAWQERGSFTTDAFMTWRGITFKDPRETRYLRFSTPCGDSGVSELAIYGYKKSDLTAEQKAKTEARPNSSEPIELTAAQRIGFNAFIDDPMSAIMAAGNVREYHNLSWLLDEDGKVKFTQGTWGDMDSFYGAMHARNISIIPCFQGGSTVISGGEKPPEIAVPEGADPSDPQSYAVHAQAMYQVAARYGSNKDVDPDTLNVSELYGAEPKVGLGYLQALENSNEPNKTWSGKANYFSPYELAAMCSADYDGHEGTIKNAGVKQADPDFKLAMGGLLNTASMLDYLSEMKLWFQYHRSDGKFAVDIINVHLGPDTYNPEDSSFVSRVAEIRQWITENAPGTELWISEFEVPMADCEQEALDNHANEKYQLRYAQRVARTYLAALGAGVDRMTKFQLRDEAEGVYYNSGLVTQKGSWNKKPAWYYTACMTNVLKNAYFAADMTKATGETAYKNYFFIDKMNGDSIYCLWSPTNEDKVLKNQKLTVPAGSYIYLTVPGEYAEGTVSKLKNDNGSVTLDIGETPVFLTISPKEKTVINGKGRYIKPEAICLEKDFSGEVCDLSAAPENSKLNQVYRMFDEPDTMPEYIYGDTAGLEKPVMNATAATVTAYVRLDRPYVFNGFGIYDTYGTGSFQIFNARTDELLWSSELDSYMSRSICLVDDTASADLLRIEKSGGDFNEVALYGYLAPPVQCDLNGDSLCNRLDVRLLQAYLLGKKVSGINNWQAGDFNGDGKLDARDLTLLKRTL